MSIAEKRMAERSKQGILAAVVVLSVAVGIAVWQFGGHPEQWLQIFYGIFAVTGIYLVIASVFEEKEISLSPSQSSYYFVIGTISAMIGILGFLSVYVSGLSVWVYVLTIIVVIALLIIIRSISKKG